MAMKFMEEHKISYRYDGRKTKKGCFESLATHSVWRVREKFAGNYKLKLSKKCNGDNNTGNRRRRDLGTICFNPKINLKDPSKYDTFVKANGDTTQGIQIEMDDKIVCNDDNDWEYKVKKEVVGLFARYFKNNPGGTISNIDEVKKVSRYKKGFMFRKNINNLLTVEFFFI